MAALVWLPLAVVGVLVVLWLVDVWREEPTDRDFFDRELARIEGEVRRARREVDRLEAEASRSLYDAALRQRRHES
jgi:hypothetical protein